LQLGDEDYERFEHQALFLFDRGLISQEMRERDRRLHILEALAGKDPSKLDSQVRDRLLNELERATHEQLRSTGLAEEWQRSWDAQRWAEALSPAIATT
jgi:hypothetical protein